MYTIFGRVIHGLDVLSTLSSQPVDEADRPLSDIKLNRITIHANPIAHAQC